LKKAKRFTKRILASVLMLLILMSVSLTGLASVSAADCDVAQTGTDVRTIYFSDNGYWSNLFAVYAWTEGSDASEWKQLDKVEGVDGLYSVELSSSYTKAIFCSRYYPGFTMDAVDEKIGDIVLEEGYNYLSLTSDTTAVWGYYNTADQSGNTAGTQKVYFTPNEEWTDIQGNLYHDFVVHAYSDADTDGVLVECSLVEGAVGQYPSVWAAEVPASYDNVEFLRAESTVENGWYVWEKTDDQTIPADSNRFTQLEDSQTGTWSYYTEPAVGPETPDDPGTDTPDNPVVPGEAQTLYFTPGAEWLFYVKDSEGRISVASKSEGAEFVWRFAEVVSEDVYSVDIPAEDTTVIFGVSFGATPDLALAKTDSQTIPANSNYFTQDNENAKTGTWSTYQSGVAGIYYSVAFVDWDGRLLSAQAVIKGGSATAPEAPERKNDSRYSYTFKCWDKSFENVTSDIIVTAQYDSVALPPAAVSTTGKLRIELAGGSSFTIAVNGGAARPQGSTYVNTKMPIGATVTVVANATSGIEFIGWMDEYGAILSPTDRYTFVASGNDYLKACYKTEVEGVNSVIFKNAKASGGNGAILDMRYYAAGDEITFPSAPSQAGYTFSGWSMTAEDIQQKLTAGEGVTVLANWEVAKVYIDVTVNGGEISTAAQPNGQYLAYNALTVVAGEASEGQKFAYWTDVDGTIMSYDAEYKFYPSKDTELTAVYVSSGETVVKKPLAFIAGDPSDMTKEAIMYTMSWDIDESIGTVTAAGLMWINEADYNEDTFKHGSGDGKLFDRTFAAQFIKQKNTYSINKTGSLYGNTYVACLFVIYTDAVTGESVTIYSDPAVITKPAP